MIEGLWTLEQAAQLIPMPNKHALYMFLHRHPEIPKRYRRSGGRNQARHGYVQRFLSDSEIKLIRDMTINEAAGARFFCRGRGSPAPAYRQQRERDSLVSWITKAANG